MSHDSDNERLLELVSQIQAEIANFGGAPDWRSAYSGGDVGPAFKGKGLAQAKITCRSRDGDEGVLRVLDPTESLVSVEIDSALAPGQVDFFITRPSGEGKVETRFLGTAKYPGSDSKWSLRFMTDRYAETPFDPLILHAEIRDFQGSLISVAVSGAAA
jgi:hypothetical protein